MQVAKFTRDFSIENHKKAIGIAKMLNLYKSNLDLYKTAVNSLLPTFMQQPVLKTGISFGLNVALSLANVKKA